VEPAANLVEVISHSPLAAARLRRRLTVEQTAKRAGLSTDEVTWLEEGRVYRFRSTDDALNACVLLSAALEIDIREAKRMAGLPVRPLDIRNPLGRLIGVSSIAALLSAIIVAVAFSTFDLGGRKETANPAKSAPKGPALPAPWQIEVDVLNGSGDINHTRRIADRISALGYHLGRVTKAGRFDYRQTAVYYEPGGRGIGIRLARQLGVIAKPLPGGRNARRLVTIVGPARGPGD
jgi:transcriptional regulator with XRE-family HTH domain